MGSKRRYLPIGMEPRYDDVFDRLRVQSVILNINVRSRDLHYGLQDMNDVRILENIKLEWTGGRDGTYLKGGNEVVARIPECKLALEVNAEKFEQYKQQRINAGYSIPEETIELHEERVELEAQWDVLTEELEEIDKWIDKAKEPVIAQDMIKVLKYGPAGRGVLKRGIIDVLDGQRCGQTEDGLLVIEDERSPYHGMAVNEYREQVVKPWARAKSFLERQKNKLHVELNTNDFKNPEFKKAWKTRLDELYELYPEKVSKELFSLKLDGKPVMPEFPEGVKNHLNGQAKK